MSKPVIALLFMGLAGVLVLGTKSIRTGDKQIDETRQIALAQIDLQIKQAQLETAEAKAALDHELAKPMRLMQGLGSDALNEQMELLNAATADYNRKSRRLKLLTQSRAAMDKKTSK